MDFSMSTHSNGIGQFVTKFHPYPSIWKPWAKLHALIFHAWKLFLRGMKPWNINFAYVQAFSPMYMTSSCGTRTRHKVPLSCPQSRCHGRNVFKPFKSEETWIKYVRTKLVWIPLTATCLQWNTDTKKIRERKLLAALLLLPSEHQWKYFQ